tara:strand:+ start:1009 stop:1275 length:267 start_codon:yes stop_codon:yes gene_type:complete
MQEPNMPIPEKIIIPASKDPGDNHFAVSLVKSVFRFVASGLLAWAGYNLWTGELMYTDFFVTEVGFLMMLSGAGFFVAEVLGVIEEIV